MLLALIGGLLLIDLLGGRLPLLALGWAALGVGGLLGVTEVLVRCLLPHAKEEERWNRFTSLLPGLSVHLSFNRPTVQGALGHSDVWIGPWNKGHRLLVQPRVLGAESPVSMELRARRGEQGGLQLGDPQFDARCLLTGEGPEFIAVLDYETRARIIGALARWDLRIVEGRLQHRDRHLDHAPEQTRACALELQSLGEQLFRVQPESIRAKLEHNAVQDPHPGVRALNLRMLLEHYVVDERALALAEAALDSPHARESLAGATALLEFSEHHHARALAHLRSLSLDASKRDAVRSRALQSFGSHAEPEEGCALIARLMKGSATPPSSLGPVAAALGRPIASEALMARFAQAPEPVRLALARALDRPEDEPCLWTLLQDPSVSVAIAAAQRLSQVGSRASVPKLNALASSWRRPNTLRRQARKAATQLLARLDGTPATGAHRQNRTGRLSLSTSSPAGDLSIQPQRRD